MYHNNNIILYATTHIAIIYTIPHPHIAINMPQEQSVPVRDSLQLMPNLKFIQKITIEVIVSLEYGYFMYNCAYSILNIENVSLYQFN